MDRNTLSIIILGLRQVALRKESVDRNAALSRRLRSTPSLSARRAWIEIP